MIHAVNGTPAHCAICQAICVEPKGLWYALNWVVSCILDREPRMTSQKVDVTCRSGRRSEHPAELEGSACPYTCGEPQESSCSALGLTCEVCRVCSM